MAITMLWPFCSQQDKQTGKFRLASDSCVKLFQYIADQVPNPWWILPPFDQCCDIPAFRGEVRCYPDVSVDNKLRRFQWDVDFIRNLPCGELFTSHDFLTIPLRHLRPDIRTYLEGMSPTAAWPEQAHLFPVAWKCADLVYCNSRKLAEMSGGVVWTFAYEDSVARARPVQRTIDVLFNARASSTNYSHHQDFMEAMEGSKLVVRMTNPTNYLTNHPWLLGPLDRNSYLDILHMSKVVVGLIENDYGGHGFREAIAAGCCPVALDTPEYRELLTDKWPYYCNLGNIRAVVEKAVAVGWPGVSTKVVREVQVNLKACSYSHAWEQARRDKDGIRKRN